MRLHLRKKNIWAAIVIIHALFAASLPADDADDYAQFVSELEKIQSDKFTAVFIAELHEYLRRFQAAPNLDEIHFKLATVFSERGEKDHAFVTNLEVAYLYPRSKHRINAKDRVRNLLIEEKNLRPLQNRVDEIVNPATSDSSRSVGHYDLIRRLYYHNLDWLSEALTASCARFIQHFPASQNLPEVNFWKAELLAKEGQEVAALTEYLKVTQLYPGSIHASASKIKIADLQTREFKMHEDAVATLDAFLERFPEDPQAPLALMRKAEITTKEMKQHQQAIAAYLEVAQRYPNSLEAVPALFAAAELYESKLKAYNEAIKVHAMIVNDFKRDIKAPYALTESARIYEDRLKDYSNAATVYAKVYQLFPDSNIAAQSLYAAAEINEKKVKNSEAALNYYRTIVDKYPTDKLAEKANKRIEKLSQVRSN